MPSLMTAYHLTKAARINRVNPACAKCGDFGFYETRWLGIVKRCECAQAGEARSDETPKSGSARRVSTRSRAKRDASKD
jgi:hypothetical protein